MFFAPPALRRRKPRVTQNDHSRSNNEDLVDDVRMGNTQSSTQQELISSIAAKVLATTSGAQAIDLAGLLQQSASAAPVTAPHKKHQCRWCIETFDKKWNKDRHEARKHAAQLEEATAVAESARQHAGGQKRSSSEMCGESSEEGVVVATSERPSKRVCLLTPPDVLEAPGCRAEGEVVEPETNTDDESESDDKVKLQIDAIIQEQRDEEALKSGVLFEDSTRKELESADAHISSCCTPFLSWLCAPSVTEAERLVKARRVDPKQLPPVKKNLAFIIRMLLGARVVEPSQFKLEVFTQEAVCQQLNTFLEERQAGASRIYALFLLIKKVLVYLSSSESVRRREYIAPNTWNSWTCVDTICSDSNTHRKQQSRNRKLLGAEQCKRLGSGAVRSAPTADDLRMPAMYGEKKLKKSDSTTAASPIVPTGNLPLATPCAQDVSTDDLRRILEGCLTYLNQGTVQDDFRFVAYLVTATLCLAMAPRQQVLRQLRLGSSFCKKDDGRYWIVMLAHMNKNGRATMFPVGEELTSAYDLYLGTIRPRLLGAKSHDYVFCKQTGDAPGPTFSFSDWTRSVCKEVIGRPVNCHAFRGALVTSYYKSGANQSEMNALADVMAHDPSTARDYYFKDDAQRQALEVHDRMRHVYGLLQTTRCQTPDVSMPVETAPEFEAPSMIY